MKKLFFLKERCDGCGACETACREKQSQSQSFFMTKLEHPSPQARITVSKSDDQYWASVCQQCVNALCVEACITGAMHYSDTGAVIHNAEQCVGCWMCVMVCPFGAVLPQNENNKAAKCNLCEGEKVPSCVLACSRNALSYCSAKEYELIVAGDGHAIPYHW